jgi:hypothetical protein
MTDANHLRQQAERCFRLARAIVNPDVVALLEGLGQELMAKAAKVDGAARC